MSPLHHSGQVIELTSGRTIFDYADEVRVRVPTSCGRVGDCHECIVEIKQGRQGRNPPTEAEAFLSGNYRRACQAAVADPGT
ncbi:MAG: 2Fe-2S iron-sulfur cluster binding domain-containing protein, partial [Dehalococcoidia bacterium]|nr:2Fe-2S iron-sulfur cluster binding domain-containing protein [Dehalococcoidia bacterium]